MVRKALITTVYKTFISPKMFMIPLNWESSHMIYHLITHISSLQCRNARIDGGMSDSFFGRTSKMKVKEGNFRVLTGVTIHKIIRLIFFINYISQAFIIGKILPINKYEAQFSTSARFLLCKSANWGTCNFPALLSSPTDSKNNEWDVPN